MGKEIYKLKISIEVLSFFNETNDYIYFQGPLDEIDKQTYIYQDAPRFFNAKKKYIEGQIRGVYEREHVYSPTGINLGGNGVYIVKCENNEEKIIRPLFKKIDVGEQRYDLSDIIKNRLYKGNIRKFYECDQFREALGDYDSFFVGLDNTLLSRIMTDNYCKNDVIWVWEWIKNSKRIYPLMRFLLMDLKHFNGDLNKYYYEKIPAKENPTIVSTQSDERLYTYRSPYKDD